VIEVSESHKPLYLFDISWGWPVQNVLNLLLVHLYPLFSYLNTHKLHFWYMEQALIYGSTYIILRKLLKDLANKFNVLLFLVRIHYKVIYIHNYTLINFLHKNVIEVLLQDR